MTRCKFDIPGATLSIASILAIGIAGCTLGEPIKSDKSDDTGIYYREPVIGAHETYTGFRYGEMKSRDAVKTYTNDSMILKVVGIEGNTVTISQKRCYTHDATCTIDTLKLDRISGRVEVLGEFGWSELEGVNLFPEGIFSEDMNRKIEFSGYAPQVDMPAVGFAPEYQVGNQSFKNVTVMVDPTGIPIDAGGKCLILSNGHRLLEILSYHVFGTDGGWELRQ